MTLMSLDSLPRGHYGAILADPPWRYLTWDKREAIPRVRSNGTNVSAAVHYNTMPIEDLVALPIGESRLLTAVYSCGRLGRTCSTPSA